MLEPQWRPQQGLMGSLGPATPGGFFSDPWTALQKRATVKDLLKIRRQVQDEMCLKRQKVVENLRSEAHCGLQHMNTVPTHGDISLEHYFWGFQSEGNPGHDVKKGPEFYPEPTELDPHVDLSPGHSRMDLSPGHRHMDLNTGHPHVDPSPGHPHMDLSPGHPHVDLSPGHPHMDLSPGHPHVDLSPGHPHMDLSPGHPHVDLSPGHLQMDLSPGHPRVDLSPGYPQMDLSPGHPHVDLSPGHPQMDLSPGHPHVDLSPPHLLCDPSPEPVCPVQSNPGASVTTLFHWQVQQQLRKMKGVPPEVLSMRDSDGDTPLHIAVAQGKRALAYVLAANMSVRGTLDTRERNGQTALHIAAATNQHLIVTDLLEHGAQVHIRDSWGRCPLHVCAEKGHVHSLLAIFRTLQALGKELDVDMVNYDGLTPLHVAVLAHTATLRQVSSLEASASGDERERLLKKGHRFLACVKALLQMGASCGAKDQKSGRTGLHMAAEEANTQLFQLLLNQPSSRGALNLPTFSGNTALHIVCALEGCRRQLEAVKMLMRIGADPGAKNLENELPCQLLPEGGATEKVRRELRGRAVHV